jgi:hypothetical protein
MDTDTAISVAALGVVAVALVVSGPFVSNSTADQPAGLGSGDAAVESVSLEDQLLVTDGRFGTGVAYLRIPDVRVALAAVEGRSRLVYSVAVPALGFERVGDRTVSPASPDTVTVGMSDRAFRYASVDSGPYTAAVSVRVQSFSADRTVFQRNVTVEVRTDE